MKRIIVAALLSSTLFASCDHDDVQRQAAEATGGDPAEGARAIAQRGCGACHSIPGLRDADATVGPPLDGIAARSFLAGLLPNTPENMVLWIRDPQRVKAGVAMPEMGIGEEEARDIAAYLYTLH